MPRTKTIKSSGDYKKNKNVIKSNGSSDGEVVAWRFNKIDRNGQFAFDVNRSDFDKTLMFNKILELSSMTWAELRRATHDNGKSKHHGISYHAMSQAARDRFDWLELMEDEDTLYSISVNNIVRIIGFKKDNYFDVLWFDPRHEVCLSRLKHT